MSKPRYGWWSYAKYMIRKYPCLTAKMTELKEVSITARISGEAHGTGVSNPTQDVALRELNPTEQKEYDAVRLAIEDTLKHPTGEQRMKLIDLIFWKNTHTVLGAGREIPCAEITAKRWHRDFIRKVGEKYGFDMKDDTTEPKK